MVKTLIKHEFHAFGRSMLPMAVILLGMALLTRFIQFFESTSSAYDIIFASTVIMFVIAIIVCLIMSVVVNVRRFYVNLFTSEGYLSMTLPVTAEQHIFAKLLVAVVGLVATVVLAALAASVAMFGDVLNEVMKAIGFLSHRYFDIFGGHYIIVIIEFILMVLSIMAYYYNVFYACISIGQMARKNRVLAAFGAYFAYYIITQVLGTVFLLLIIALPDWWSDMANRFFMWSEQHPYASTHAMLWFAILFYAAIAVGLFYLTRYIIKNRLNLE